MFGELFLEDIHSESVCLGPEPFQSCDITGWALPVLTGLYMIMVNTVLV